MTSSQLTIASGAPATHTNLTPDIWGATDRGRNYDHNEDSISPAGAGVPLLHGGFLLLVADGVGGSQVGEQASDMAMREIVRYVQQQPANLDPAQVLHAAVQVANTQVCNFVAGSPTVHDAASTVVVALIRNDQLHLAHVGDSRAYLLRHDTVEQLTIDHTLTQQKIDRGLLRPEHAREDPERNVITRSLGSPTLQVDVNIRGIQTLQPGDVLLLCSDGLTDMLTDSEIAQIIGRRSAKQAATRLIAAANRRGGLDNISAVVARIPGGQAGGGFPWPYLLLGFGAVLLLLALTLLAGSFLWRGSSAGVSSPAATATFTPTAPSAAAAIQPANTAPPSASQSDVLPTPSPEPIVTSTPLPTYTPAPIPTLNAQLPPVSSSPDNPGGTKVASSPESSSEIPAAAQMPDTAIAAPILQEPNPNDTATQGQSTTFRWSWTGELGVNQGFEIRIWRNGDIDHYGAFDATELKKYVVRAGDQYVTSFPVEGAYSVQRGGGSDYLWTVAVVQIDPYLRLGPETEARPLKYALRGRSGGGGGQKDNKSKDKPDTDAPTE